MRLATLFDLLNLPPAVSTSTLVGVRSLQELPDYTSPPLPSAIVATPPAFRDDAVIDAARDADANGECPTLDDPTACQIIFSPPASAVESGTAKLGVVFYGGALVDPRGYSPMMKMLSDNYGLHVAVPIFENDLAFKFGTCDSGRLKLAQKAFPDVEKWVLAGHSFGGLQAFSDVWSMSEMNDTDAIGGLALIASYVRQDLACGTPDFSSAEDWGWLPATSISATLDGVVNTTNFDAGQMFLPQGDGTFTLVIPGGNHGQFGTYDYTERKTLLGQIDGNTTIPAEVQQSLVAGAIAHVAARSGVPLPSWNRTESPQNATKAPSSSPTVKAGEKESEMPSSGFLTPIPSCDRSESPQNATKAQSSSPTVKAGEKESETPSSGFSTSSALNTLFAILGATTSFFAL